MDPLQKRKLNGLLLGTSCLVASSLIALAPALAGNVAASAHPTGGNIVSGNAKIGDHGRKITQTSEKALIDWSSFNIGVNQTVRIKGPNANAVTVNRVTGADASEIDGALRANDNVWLLNGNGILFGKGSVINVGSLIATTSDLSDDDFRKGKYRFKAGSNPNASVINRGTITAADGGTVVLSAAHVANEGVVQANLGNVVLGGANAFTVDLNGDNLIRYQVTGEVKQAPTDSKGAADKALVSNSGRIVADGGTVLMTSRAASNVQDNVVNNSGMIEATSVGVHNGEVDLDAGTLDQRQDGYRQNAGAVDDSGRIDVAGGQKGETGGTVRMTAANVVVANGAHINASGYDGGGTVLIGGELHGRSGLKRAGNVTIGKAVINVDATHNGNGGKVSIWSRHDTVFDGVVKAEGGRHGGNGGFVETSGHELGVGADALVRTSAARGGAGSWLLDPTDVDIGNCSNCVNGNISAVGIANALDVGTDVTIEAIGSGAASGNITVSNAINADGTGTLSLLAMNNIDIEASIQNSSSGAINLVAGWDGSTGVASPYVTGSSNNPVNMTAIIQNHAYGALVGQITLGSTGGEAVAVGSAGGLTTFAADNLFVGHPGASQTANAQLGYNGNGGGDIDVYLVGNLTLQTEGNGYSQIGNGDSSRQNSAATNVSGDIVLNVEGNTTISGTGARTAWIGNVAFNNSDSETGDVTLDTNSLVVNSNGSADHSLFGNIIASDLTGSITTATSGQGGQGGGNVTIAITSSCGTIDWGNYFANGLDFANGNTLSLLSEGAMTFSTSIQAVENGNINAIAGWDGSTGLSASGINIATILANTAYGTTGSSDITIGGSGATGSVMVGTQSGTTTVAADDVNVLGTKASAQIGYLGVGTGDVTVDAIGDVTITASSNDDCLACFAQIGNGAPSPTVNHVRSTTGDGNQSGNITVNSNGTVTLTGGAEDYSYAQIGNGGDSSDGNRSGNISVNAENVYVNGSEDYAQIGNGGWGVHGTNIGNVTITVIDNVDLSGAASDDDGFGNAQIGNGGQRATGNDSGDISVSAGGLVSLTAGANNNYAQIGNGGTAGGSNSGNITISTEDLSFAGSSSGQSYTQIGNGAVLPSEDATSSIAASGNISVSASGDTTLESSNGGSHNWIGNDGNGTLAGSVTWATGLLTLGNDANGDFSNFIGADLVGGNFTLELTNPSGTKSLPGVANYSSANTLKILSVGDVDITGSIQNSGSGAIYIVGGWDGTTTKASNLTNAGVYGNNGGSVSIGSGSNSVIVGSKSGTTTVAGDDVTVDGEDQLAQIGWNGTGSGDISVFATGDVTLQTSASSECTYCNAVIGNGNGLVSNAVSGNITINAGSVSLLAEDTGDRATIGNRGTGSVDGDIQIVTSGDVTLNASAASAIASIGNYTTSNAGTTGDVMLSVGGSLYMYANHGGEGTHGAGAYIGSQSSSSNIKVTVAQNIVMATSGNGHGDYSSHDYVQIGNYGSTQTNSSASGNVTVTATHGNITLTNNTDRGAVLIGNSPAKTVSGNIKVTAKNGNINLEANYGGLTQIGNGPGGYSAGANVSGNISVTANGNISLVSTGRHLDQESVVEIGNGPATVQTSGDITVKAGGKISLESEYKYTTARIGNDGSDGAASGNIKVTAGGAILLSAEDKYSVVQIGNGAPFMEGNASGNIVVSGSSLTVSSSYSGTTYSGNVVKSYAAIGNGDVAAGGRGAASGNISLNIAGLTTLDTHGDAWIGNLADQGSKETGNVAFVTGTLDIANNGTLDSSSLGDMIVADLGTSSSTGGNFTLAFTNPGTTYLQTYLGDGITYTSPHALTFLTTGTLAIEDMIQNKGTGALSAIAGWNGSTMSVANIMANTSDYGLNSGEVFVLGDNSDVGAAFGSKDGTTTVAGADVYVQGVGQFAQVGYHGSNATGAIVVSADGNPNNVKGSDSVGAAHDACFDSDGNVCVGGGGSIDGAFGNGGEYAQIGSGVGASGNISVSATGNIVLTGGGLIPTPNGCGEQCTFYYYNQGGGTVSNTPAMIGNGDPLLASHNNVSGNISIDAGGWLDLDSSTVTSSEAWIGNRTGGNGVESGAVTIITGTESDDGAVSLGDMIEADLGTTSQKGSGGDVTIATTDTDTLTLGFTFDYSSPNALTFLTAGSLIFTGDLQNAGTGDITIATGWNPSVAPSQVMTTAGAFGNGNSTLTIGGSTASGDSSIGTSGGDLTILSDNLSLVADNGYAQLGYHGAGTGDIDVDISGTLTLDGGKKSSLTAQIGDGSKFDTSSTGDAVLIAAGSIAATGHADVAGDSAEISISGNGGIGSASNPLEFAVNDLAIQTDGGNVYATSSTQGVSLGVGSVAVDLNGGDFSLVADGEITQTNSISAGGIDFSTTDGSNIELKNGNNEIGTAEFVSQGNVSLDDASALTIAGATVGGSLNLDAAGNIDQTGAISANNLVATAESGSINLSNKHNNVNVTTLSASKSINFYDAGNLDVKGVNAGGNAAIYDTANMTIGGADVGGNLTLLAEGNLTFVSSVQLTNGDLLAVAGWDGTTTSASGLVKKGAYGNNGGSIIIGGTGAGSDVAVGSKNGSTTLAGENVSLEADNGYAQIGYHGAATDDITVLAVKDVTLSGGNGADMYAQIGNGGMGVSGNESGDITISAGGDVSLDGGKGKDAYAQIGNGGAHADKNSHGYTNSGNITIAGQTVALVAGSGDESYAQIGNGGFDVGDGLSGQGNNEGNIIVAAIDGVTLSGGDGNDAFAQIGNGGDQSNANAGSNAGGTDSGDITVSTTSGSVSDAAGSGTNAYTQIGNGGFDVNEGGNPSNFSITGAISVSDLTLTGSDTGDNGYAQIGNGDGSGNGAGDVSGDITIDAGTITLTNGKAKNANAMISNAIGDGTVTGTVAGYTAPSQNDGSTQGVISSTIQQTTQTTAQQVSLVVSSQPTGSQGVDNGPSQSPGPLEQLAGGKDSDEGADSATDALGQSLGGHKHNVQTVSLIPGVLTQIVSTETTHGIPPANQDFSSWGNEALWRW